jgi:hypothetical protein
MKKLIITSLFLSCVSMAGFSQGISVGLRAGLNMATITGKGVANVNFKAGGFGGAYLTAMLGGKIGIQPEALFSMQGYSVTGGNYTFNYVNIPVFVRFNVAKIINIHAGPQFGLLLSAKVKPTGGSSTDVKDNYKSSDIAAVIGAGVELPFKLNAGIRFNVGLTDINNITGSTATIKNTMLQVFVGYSIIGKK